MKTLKVILLLMGLESAELEFVRGVHMDTITPDIPPKRGMLTGI